MDQNGSGWCVQGEGRGDRKTESERELRIIYIIYICIYILMTSREIGFLCELASSASSPLIRAVLSASSVV